jgi:hypothetical protein
MPRMRLHVRFRAPFYRRLQRIWMRRKMLVVDNQQPANWVRDLFLREERAGDAFRRMYMGEWAAAPHPAQVEAMARAETRLLYGGSRHCAPRYPLRDLLCLDGSRGGGKTERMRQERIAAEKDGRRWIGVDWGFGPDATVVSTMTEKVNDGEEKAR